MRLDWYTISSIYNFSFAKCSLLQLPRVIEWQIHFFSILYFYRDLKGWIHTMTILVTNDELAKDVVGAEALLDRHRVS